MNADDELDPEQLVRDSQGFSRHVIELAAGEELPLDRLTLRDAIVFVTSGELELECVSGQRRRFDREAILCLTPSVRLLRSSGDEPARLVAIARKRTG